MASEHQNRPGQTRVPLRRNPDQPHPVGQSRKEQPRGGSKDAGTGHWEPEGTAPARDKPRGGGGRGQDQRVDVGIAVDETTQGMPRARPGSKGQDQGVNAGIDVDESTG